MDLSQAAATADRSATGLDIEVRGEGRPLVLLHSMLSDRSTFDRIVLRLAPHRRVVLPNLPGYGRSPLHESSVAEIAATLAEALQDLGLEPAETDVLGNGLGHTRGIIWWVGMAPSHKNRADKPEWHQF